MRAAVVILTIISLAMISSFYLAHRDSESKIYSMDPPQFTGIVGAGTIALRYEKAYQLIKESGCVQKGDYFGSAQMNCVLEKYGYAYRVQPGEHVIYSLELLEGKR